MIFKSIHIALSKFKKRILNNHLKVQIEIPKKWLGSEYGGFFLAENSINSNSIVYSFGIGKDISFDSDLIKDASCKIYAFDPTPSSLDWLKSQNLPFEFNYFDFGISNLSGWVNFYLPVNSNFVSGSLSLHDSVDNQSRISVRMRTFAEIAKEFKHEKIDLVKMDIEGAEYDVIESILDSEIEVKQILVEIHDRFYTDGRTRSIKMINKLNEKGFKIFAVSDSLEEISLIKN